MSPFEVPEGPYHIEAVMAAIRARIIEPGPEPQTGGAGSGAANAALASPQAIIEDGSATARLHAPLHLAGQRFNLEPLYRIESHRPVLGFFTNFLKRVIYWGSRPYADALRTRQDGLNEAMIGALWEASAQLEALRSQLSDAKARIEEERKGVTLVQQAFAVALDRLQNGVQGIEARLEQFEQIQLALKQDAALRDEQAIGRLEQQRSEIGTLLEAVRGHGAWIVDLAHKNSAEHLALAEHATRMDGLAARLASFAGRHDLEPFFKAVPPERRRQALDNTRGTEGDIAGRQSIYVDLFREMPGKILDVGCGRGELLHQLRHVGIECWGAEIDPLMIELTRSHGNYVVPMDALGVLRSVQPGELGGLFAAQVVEHLFPGELLEFLRLARNRLAPGGRIVLETINAGSLGAIAKSYWRDLDHKQPLHPEYLKLLLEMIGFEQVEIRLLSPFRDDERAPPLPPAAEIGLTPAARDALQSRLDRIGSLLWGAQDFYVTARQPSELLPLEDASVSKIAAPESAAS